MGQQQAERSPLDVIQRARDEFGIREAIVAFSTGKDAAATLDLCVKHFDRVEAFYMYLVPDLEFQERYLRARERQYSIPIHRIPHWTLADMYRGASLRFPTKQSNVRQVRIRDTYAYMRKKTGIEWVATGERCQESLERNAQIRRVEGVNPKRRVFWPVGFWSESQVFSYLKQCGLALSSEYNHNAGGSFSCLWYHHLAPIRDRFPEDFAKIVKFFPFIPAQMMRYEQGNAAEAFGPQSKQGRRRNQVPEVRGPASPPEPTEERAVQPTDDGPVREEAAP